MVISPTASCCLAGVENLRKSLGAFFLALAASLHSSLNQGPHYVYFGFEFGLLFGMQSAIISNSLSLMAFNGSRDSQTISVILFLQGS